MKHSFIESILFSTNEIEMIEASAIQVFHENGAGPWVVQTPLLGGPHQGPAWAMVHQAYMLKKALEEGGWWRRKGE